MVEKLITHGLQYGVYVLELFLFLFLLRRGEWRRLTGAWLYVGFLFLVDGLARPYVLYRFGFTSTQYAYFFWLTDAGLLIAAFLLVSDLFRRACRNEEVLWRHVRLLLNLVFVLVLAISLISLHRNYQNLFSSFIVEFQQNLYFTCLILVTLLFFLLQYMESMDEELILIVTGMGIQFAGPAASLALFYLAPEQNYSRAVWNYGAPLCTLAMLLLWFYATTQGPKALAVPGPGRKASGLAEATLRKA
ncbi:MAG: hypothetical protein HYS33_06740 [Acidobacteria bacterium]|nr:hypothetical protein [Acidobacteriota bacterium]